jgi:hypothetical protein
MNRGASVSTDTLALPEEPTMRHHAVELEADEDGYHAIVLDATDTVLHITDSYPTLEAAARAAWTWLDREHGRTTRAS